MNNFWNIICKYHQYSYIWWNWNQRIYLISTVYTNFYHRMKDHLQLHGDKFFFSDFGNFCHFVRKFITFQSWTMSKSVTNCTWIKRSYHILKITDVTYKKLKKKQQRKAAHFNHLKFRELFNQTHSSIST